MRFCPLEQEVGKFKNVFKDTGRFADDVLWLLKGTCKGIWKLGIGRNWQRRLITNPDESNKVKIG